MITEIDDVGDDTMRRRALLLNRSLTVMPIWSAHECRYGLCSNGKECPERDQGKHPVLRSWKNRDESTQSEVFRWWNEHPRANIGILTGWRSGFNVIDIDPRNGGSYEALKKKFPDVPEPHVSTGGGGLHLYIKYPVPIDAFRRGVKSTSSSKLIGLPGFDYKGDGGYVLAPPSDHVSGGVYQWLRTDPPQRLKWLEKGTEAVWEASQEKKRVSAVKREELRHNPRPEGSTGFGAHMLGQAVDKITSAAAGKPGGRHDTVRNQARLLAGLIPTGHVTEDEIFQTLYEVGCAVVEAGREAEIERTIDWAIASGVDLPWEPELPKEVTPTHQGVTRT